MDPRVSPVICNIDDAAGKLVGILKTTSEDEMNPHTKQTFPTPGQEVDFGNQGGWVKELAASSCSRNVRDPCRSAM